MSKQTAVEWLIEQLRGTDEQGDFIFNGVITSELIEQTKQVEKNQIIDAFMWGIDEGEYRERRDPDDEDEEDTTPTQYYERNYGNKG